MRYPPDKAMTAAGMRAASRVRLIPRADGAVYVFEGANGTVAIRALDLKAGGVESPALALEVAREHARNRGISTRGAEVLELASRP